MQFVLARFTAISAAATSANGVDASVVVVVVVVVVVAPSLPPLSQSRSDGTAASSTAPRECGTQSNAFFAAVAPVVVRQAGHTESGAKDCDDDDDDDEDVEGDDGDRAVVLLLSPAPWRVFASTDVRVASSSCVSSAMATVCSTSELRSDESSPAPCCC